MLKHGILGLLNYHEMTGYEIMEVFRDSLHFFWEAKTSQIYKELHGLEQKNWAVKTLIPQNGKPNKNLYAITESGRLELLRWLSNDDSGVRSKVPLLMKVFFLGERSAEENIPYFEQIIKNCDLLLKSLESVPRHIDQYRHIIEQEEKSLYWQMTLEYGRRITQMQKEWAQDCIKRLKED